MMTGEVAGRVPLEPANRIAPVGACGDEHARMAALFDAHHRRLYTLARRLSNNADEARDLVQETFLRVATAADRVPHGSSHEEAWLVRVLVNLCRDRWRRLATRRSYVERHPPEVADRRNAETALVAQSVVWQALAQLAPRRRAIVVMHELEDRSPAEIARTLGVAAVTVRWHLSRGRRELAQIIRGVAET
jgi:RNA polymerase sigma-70 factor, ECF subfamily